jgi:hypothetical protein
MTAHQSCSEALETTLGSLDLTHEAASVVAVCRMTARRLDEMPTHIDAYASVTNAYLRQLAELRKWLPVPDVVEEDPFDALVRALHEQSPGDDA